MEYENDDLVVREIDGVSIVRFKLENLQQLHDLERIGSQINSLIDGGARKVVLDFKHVRWAGSAALSLMLATRKRLGECKGRLVLSHLENIIDLLRVSKTQRLFDIAPGPQEALAMLG